MKIPNIYLNIYWDTHFVTFDNLITFNSFMAEAGWTGFYMITASVMKELTLSHWLQMKVS